MAVQQFYRYLAIFMCLLSRKEFNKEGMEHIVYLIKYSSFAGAVDLYSSYNPLHASIHVWRRQISCLNMGDIFPWLPSPVYGPSLEGWNSFKKIAKNSHIIFKHSHVYP